jgi:glycine betaine/choline ABC-type transport system substrate-binding protein/ABC-type proline/glycine betaine transport system permease subunit
MTTWESVQEFLSEPTTWSGPDSIWARLGEHIWVSVAAVIIAGILVLPLAVWLGHIRRGSAVATAVVNIGRAVPSFGILAIAFLVLVQMGAGVGEPWAVLVALVALAAPPMFTNTVAGIQAVEPATIESARGMGLTEREVLTGVELPLSAPLMMEGLRIAFVQVIATATLGALVAWGGLGRYIVDGFARQDMGRLIVGAVLVGLLAIAAELGLSAMQRATTPHGIRPARSALRFARWALVERQGLFYNLEKEIPMRKPFRAGAVGAILGLALVATACGSGDGAEDGTPPDGDPIRVASFNFNESAIVAEIYAQGLEANGYTVERQLNLGNREVVKPALEEGEIDLIPEYTGTVAGFLGAEASSDSDATWEAARAAWEESGITLLAYSPAQDKNAYVVTGETAEEFGLTTVSDLGPVAGEMIFGGPPECPERPLCLQGLQEVYGLEFAEFVPLDVGGPITVAALEGGEIDVGLLFTTSGVIAANEWVSLEDDMGLNPAENIVPAIRTEVVEAYGDDLVALLDSYSEALTTEDLTAMNARADLDQEDPALIAEEWLTTNGFLE